MSRRRPAALRRRTEPRARVGRVSQRHLIFALALLWAFPALGQLPVEVVRRGTVGAVTISEGEPVSFILEYASQLKLTEEQRSALMQLRRRLRAANAPFLRQLDSLRDLTGVPVEPTRLTGRDLEAIERFQRLAQPIVDSLRARNEVARSEARTLLLPEQLARLDSIATALRRPGHLKLR